MSPGITGSVGRWEKGAQNKKADVLTVQRLLKRAGKALSASALDPKGLDGMIAHPPGASATVNAIEAFQRRLTSSVDGIVEDRQSHLGCSFGSGRREVDTAGRTGCNRCSRRLSGMLLSFCDHSRAELGRTAARVCFAAGRRSPVTRRMRSLFSAGTPIHAIADGLVTRGPYPFYCQTFALEIDHGSFLARYGEIQSRTEVHAGDRVSAGQKIANVGHLVGIKVPSDMLHFELYDKSRSGALTVGSGPESAMKNGVPFMRRKDLIDPTSKLNQWRANLPPA